MPECAAGLPGCRRQGDIIEYLGVAQFGSVSEWGSEGRRFKSSHPDHRRSRGCIACSDFFCKSHRALTPLRFPFPVARRKKPPCPAARGRLSCSAFSSFSFVKASREEVGGGPILSLPFPFDPLSRKRTENGPPGSSACRRDRRPERAGGRGAGQIGRGAGGGINGGALMDTKEPGGKDRPAPVPDEMPLPDAKARAGARRRDRRAGRARAGISRWAQAARGRAGGGPRRGCTWNRSKASEWGTAS